MVDRGLVQSKSNRLRSGPFAGALGAFLNVTLVLNRRTIDRPTSQQILDCYKLEPRVLPPRRRVEPGAGRFLPHRSGRFFEADEDADIGLFAIGPATKIAVGGRRSRARP